MKSIEINGVKYLILGADEKICISTGYESNVVKIENSYGNLTISKCNKTLNEVIFDNDQSNIDYLSIFEKCDKWLECFYDIHDKFVEVVLSKGYNKKNVRMELSFGEYTSENGTKCRTINLDLKHFENIVEEGITISLDENSKDIYQYLVANVLDYYINQNYIIECSSIDYNNDNFSFILYSSYENTVGSCPPILANLQALHTSDSLTSIVKSIIECHNTNKSTKDIIVNLRVKISNETKDNSLNRCIKESYRQYQLIMKKNYQDIKR